MSALAYSPNAYREGAILSAPPEKLVVMLYDGARRFLLQASVAMREGQTQPAHAKLRRAEDIIAHLSGTLDMEQGGEIAERLEAIYAFCQGHLLQARFDRDPAKVEKVSDLLGGLRESWAAIAA